MSDLAMKPEPAEGGPPGGGAESRGGERMRPAWRRALGFVGVSVAGTTMLAAMAGGVALLHLRADAEPRRAAVPPVSVQVAPITMSEGYARTVRYTGRLEARRRTALGFERGGRVVAVLVDEGEAVAEGDVVARLDTAELEMARLELAAQKRELEAQQELAKLTLGRQTRLKSDGWSPEQRMDEAEATLAGLTARLERIEAGLGANAIALEKSELKAPFAGTVAARDIDEGAVVAAGAPVLGLIETGALEARIGLPPDVADGFQTGKRYRLQLGEDLFEGRLRALRADLAVATRTVTALFGDITGAAPGRIGDLVSVEAREWIGERGAWVALTALKEGRRGLWSVLVLRGSGPEAVVAAEAVELLHVSGERAYVRGTFRPGDLILEEGTDRVVSGQRVAFHDVGNEVGNAPGNGEELR